MPQNHMAEVFGSFWIITIIIENVHMDYETKVKGKERIQIGMAWNGMKGMYQESSRFHG
jgi:hypothetical protein